MLFSEEFFLRKARASDAIALFDLSKECFPFEFYSLQDIEYEIASDASVFYVAETSDSVVVGFSVSHYIIDELELLQIGISEQYRNLGVGHKLLSSLFSWGKLNSIRAVYLELRSQNIKALNFYEKNGFAKLYLRRNYYKNPIDDAIVMLKHI